MRRGWVRDAQVIALVDAFVVCAVASLMLLRLYLFLSGYPQVGGGGLHIAHMVWGVLILLAGLLISVCFLPHGARWTGAVLGGIGFGLLIDELGKFLTSDNDYFFKPAPVLIYGVLIAIFLGARYTAGRRGLTAEECLANALEMAKKIAMGDLEPRDRDRALTLLDRAGDSALAHTLRTAFEEARASARPGRLERLHQRATEAMEDLTARRWFPRAFSTLIVLAALGSAGEVLLVLMVNHDGWRDGPVRLVEDALHGGKAISVVSWFEFMVAGVSGLFACVGALGRPLTAKRLRLVEYAALLWVTVLQPFAFYEAQFFASAGMVGGIGIFALVQYLLRHEREGDTEVEARGARKEPGRARQTNATERKRSGPGREVRRRAAAGRR